MSLGEVTSEMNTGNLLKGMLKNFALVLLMSNIMCVVRATCVFALRNKLFVCQSTLYLRISYVLEMLLTG
jgi:hypothetical protein